MSAVRVENSKKSGLIISNNKDVEETTDKTQSSGFIKNTKYIKKDVILPKGIIFESVEVVGENQAQKTGQAYIYYTPAGLVDESAIHISAGDGLNWTIAIHPLTGKADIFTSKILLKDLRNQ